MRPKLSTATKAASAIPRGSLESAAADKPDFARKTSFKIAKKLSRVTTSAVAGSPQAAAREPSTVVEACA